VKSQDESNNYTFNQRMSQVITRKSQDESCNYSWNHRM